MTSRSYETGFNKLELPNDLAFMFLYIYKKELETGFQRKMCIQMFIAELFTIGQNRNNPNAHQWMYG